MKACVVALWLVLACSRLPAQGAAFNPNCYYPRIGNRQEIDTIYGSTPNSRMGLGIRNILPRPGESYGTIAGYGERSSFDGGPDFDLRHLKENHRLNFQLPWRVVKIGNFRDTYHNDILEGSDDGQARLYWEDDHGNYDSLRYSMLQVPSPDTSHFTGGGITPFCAKALSDSVYDIFYPGQSLGPGRGFFIDTIYLCMARGGKQLTRRKDTIYADEWAFVNNEFNPDSSEFFCQVLGEANFNSGTGGIMAIDRNGNLFYQRLSTHFHLHDLIPDLLRDTLIAVKGIPGFSMANHYYALPRELRIFPRANEDRSTDLLFPASLGDSIQSFYAFRGGQDFGSHRLTLDSAGFVMHSPSFYGDQQLERQMPLLYDCGDIIGRGNHVLCAEYSPDPLFAAYCFYELGTELDDKIDMYYEDGPQPLAYGDVDTVTVKSDGLPHVIVGEGGRYDFDHPPYGEYGTIQIIYGTSRIPRRPGNSVSMAGALSESVVLSVWPNPLTEHRLRFTFRSPRTGDFQIDVRDVLGRLVASKIYALTSIGGNYELDLPGLPPGTYVLESLQDSTRCQLKFVTQF